MKKKDAKTLRRHSDLITDLAIRGASRERIAEAVEESRKFIDEARQKTQKPRQ